MTINTEKLSPMMKQWQDCKQKAQEALLLFRLGDFYEAFYEDAKLLSESVDVTLTQRQGVPMAGVPAHAAEGYIEKLVEKGLMVAIAEQIEDPKEAKGIVKRDVVRVISPGTFLSSLPENGNNFFGALSVLNQTVALALLDFSTGEFRALEFVRQKDLLDELYRRSPSELLVSEKDQLLLSRALDEITKETGIRITAKENWRFSPENAHAALTSHFQVHSLEGFGLKEMVAAITAAGSLLHYVQDALNLKVAHIKTIKADHLSSYLAIDQATQKNLELIEPLHKGSRQFTLLKLLDQTVTPMGARLLKTWLIHPLLSPFEIKKRQQGVKELLDRGALRDTLRPVRDLERLLVKIETESATPRDLAALKTSLSALPSIETHVKGLHAPILKELSFPSLTSCAEEIDRVLVEDPPAKLGEGNLIRIGVDQELDTLKDLKKNSQAWMANYQTELRETYGIKTLKVVYSKAFGYCIEVSRGQAERIPDTFQRRQTLVNSERFISPELKSYEEKILTAEDKIQGIEETLFRELKNTIKSYAEAIHTVATSLALLDALLSLAFVAKKNRYVAPEIDEGEEIAIETSRHAVIEASLKDHSFIPNDVFLNGQDTLHIITGPNMAGKSTYIRQVALLIIMAQMGSFIPAQKAKIGIVDKVFSRIGASDDLSKGQSTFMIEMTETANILNNATSKSLVILDEIGRGTSTFDGISIAWAVAEELLKKRAKTLFATHYWELTELEKTHSSVKNVHVAVEEASDRIVFMWKILPGSTDKSYGIHVAKLAGLPRSALKRAEEMLHKLEKNDPCLPTKKKEGQKEQLSFFENPPSPFDTLGEELQTLDLDHMTPLEALQILSKWKTQIR